MLRVMEKIKKKSLEESLNTIISKICILVEKCFWDNLKSINSYETAVNSCLLTNESFYPHGHFWLYFGIVIQRLVKNLMVFYLVTHFPLSTFI